jgi:hypothetical protein
VLGLTLGLLVFVFTTSDADDQTKLMVTIWLSVTSLLMSVGAIRLIMTLRQGRPTDAATFTFLLASFLTSVPGILLTPLALVYMALSFTNLMAGWLSSGRSTRSDQTL